MNESKIISSIVMVVLIVLGLVMVGVFVGISEDVAPESSRGTEAVSAVDYTEDFQLPDLTGTNPSDSWYSYAENGWDYANVTDTQGVISSNQSYYINDTAGGGDYSTFTFDSKEYTSASFYFMFDDTYHNESLTTLESADGSDLLYFNLTDTKAKCYEGDGTLLWSEDISSGQWYYISVALNWEGEFTASLYSVSIAGTLIAVGDGGTGDMSAGAVSYGSCAIFNASGVTSQPTGLYYDNVSMYKDAISATEGELQQRVNEVSNQFATVIGIVIFAIVMTILIGTLILLKKKK